MNIGISICSRAGQNIWENGLGQNIVFLAQLLRQLPMVDRVFLIDIGDQRATWPQVAPLDLDVTIIDINEATHLVDVVIEMGGTLDVEWLAAMRQLGKKVVYHRCAQPYVGLVEPLVSGRLRQMSKPDHCDEVWLLPKDAGFAPLMQTMHRCPVRIVPYIWHPAILQLRISELASTGLRYGFPQSNQCAEAEPAMSLLIAIFEPNISVVKTSVIPMLICDAAYRSQPESVSMMTVLNTLHLVEHPTLLALAGSLELVQHGKAVFVGRIDIAGFMAEHANAVVAHQWGNDQNYGYLDALYGNYPLVHNSPWLKDAGYYYPDADVIAGAEQLQVASRHHAHQIDDYARRSLRIFDAVDPFNEANLAEYALRLSELCS